MDHLCHPKTVALAYVIFFASVSHVHLFDSASASASACTHLALHLCSATATSEYV